ncbi:hypothetical protein HPB52_015354 [Rhipicephalus sanguineus]|uniref:Uncharacterized protein n=1 Tax=Rhipicephalus sanguineus TaxID=34632 RepID=A0A9D4TAM3_RHISA|nr:hypothetical protein HPB52_015354 [Rhipicephalus sanguineus]
MKPRSPSHTLRPSLRASQNAADNHREENLVPLAILKKAQGYLGTKSGKFGDLYLGVMHCQFTDMITPGNLISAEATSRTPRERESIQNFDAPRASFEQVDGDKGTPLARLAQTSLRDNCQLVLRSEDFIGVHYVLGPAIESSDAEGCVRVRTVSSRSLGFLTDPITVDATAVKANATKRYIGYIRATPTTGNVSFWYSSERVASV